jgi:hypothetical protein
MLEGVSRFAAVQEGHQRWGLTGSLFWEQRRALAHPSRRKCALVPRRGGKTTLCLVDTCEDQKTHPGADYVYLALSRDAGERIVWKDLKRLDREHELGINFVDSRLIARFPNGATFTILGIDKPGWEEKFRGVGRYRRVIIDEAKSYTIDVESFVAVVVRPTLVDLLGTLWMIGTPGSVARGIWYDLTRPEPELRRKGWEFFTWGPFDNPWMSTQIRQEWDELAAEYGETVFKEPWFLREWMGQWVIDTTDNVYAFDAQRNGVDEYPRPIGSAGEHYVLGLDFGHSDAYAESIGAWNDDDPNYYILESWKRAKNVREGTEEVLLDETAERCKMYLDKYPGLRIVADYASRTLITELQKRFRVPVIDAEKEEKKDWIRVLNTDLRAGKVLVVKPELQPYAEEATDLKKKFKPNGEWIEHPKQSNDCCDTVLYGYRYSYHYRYQKPTPQPPPGSPEAMQRIADELREKRFKKIARQKRRRRF